MYKILRIICCILAAAAAGAAALVFIYAGTLWGVAAVVSAAVFGALTVTFKQLQENEERKKNPPPSRGDFIYGKVEEENEDEKGV